MPPAVSQVRPLLDVCATRSKFRHNRHRSFTVLSHADRAQNYSKFHTHPGSRPQGTGCLASCFYLTVCHATPSQPVITFWVELKMREWPEPSIKSPVCNGVLDSTTFFLRNFVWRNCLFRSTVCCLSRTQFPSEIKKSSKKGCIYCLCSNWQFILVQKCHSVI